MAQVISSPQVKGMDDQETNTFHIENIYAFNEVILSTSDGCKYKWKNVSTTKRHQNGVGATDNHFIQLE